MRWQSKNSGVWRRSDATTGGPMRHVRDEVPVHDVDVQPVGRRGHLAHLLGQHAEVGREHRRRDAQVADLAGVALRVPAVRSSTRPPPLS